MKALLSTLILCIALFASSRVSAQGVGIGTTTFSPTSDALLEMRSTTSGILIPRMTMAQRDAIASPSTGLMVFQTNSTPGFYYYNGSAWASFGADNLGTHSASQKLVLNDFIIANASGSQGIRLDNNGNLGVGTAAPAERLQVDGNVILTRGGSHRTISVETEPSTSTAVPARNLTIQAANAASDNMAFAQRGGDLVLQAGNGFTNTVAGSHGGNVTIRSGANHLNSGSVKNGGDIILETGGVLDTYTERLRIMDSGNIGVGINAPVEKLQVHNGDVRLSNTGTAGELQFQGTSTGISTFKAGAQGATTINYTLPITAPTAGQVLSSTAAGVLSWTTSSGWGLTGNTGTTASVAAIGAAVNNNFMGTTDARDLVFATNNLERYRVTSSGNIGVGTLAPANRLEIIHNGGSGASDDVAIKSYGTGVNPQLVLQAARGTSAAPSNLVNGDEVGSLSFWGQNGGAGNLMTRMRAMYTGNGTTNLSDLRVSTSGVEHMRVDETGKVMMANNAAAFAPKASLHLYGDGASGYSVAGTAAVPNPSEGPELGFGRGGFSSGLGAAIQFIDYDGYSGGLAFLVHRGANNGAGGAFADNWPTDVIQTMTMVNNGRIGVGTSDPSEKFQVHDGDIRLSNSGTAGEMQFQGTSTGITTFKAGAQGASNINYTLPIAAAASNGAVLASTTAGVLSWDAFLKPTTVTSNTNTSINPASYTAGTVSGMSIASVPAGTYLVTFSADISRNGSTACSCVVRAGGTDMTDTERSFEIPAAVSQYALVGKITLGATGTVEIRCRKTSGGAGFTVGKRAMSLQSTN